MGASVDTNVLLRVALQDEADQAEQAEALLASGREPYHVVDAVWLEMTHALEHHYAFSRGAVVDVIRSLLARDCLRTERDVIEATCMSYVEHRKLSFADCYLAARASHDGATPLYTFDEKMAKQHVASELVPKVISA